MRRTSRKTTLGKTMTPFRDQSRTVAVLVNREGVCLSVRWPKDREVRVLLDARDTQTLLGLLRDALVDYNNQAFPEEDR